MDEILELNGQLENETLVLSNTYVHGEIAELESCHFCQSMYGQRMINYWPQVVSCIKEFRAIIEAEYPEFDLLADTKDEVINDAYLLTMGEERIESWEKILGIIPIVGSSVDDRRDTIIARIRGQGKLNTALINAIVNAFTGGTAKSYVKNSTLYVIITPPRNNKQYQFANVRQEIAKKTPAHLGLNVSRNYFTWGDINDNFDTWEQVNTDLPTWEDVYLFIPFT